MSLNYSVEVKGFDALLKDVRKAGANADPLMRGAIQNAVSRIQSSARSKAPHRTGTLQRSILTEVFSTNGRVYVGEKYGIYFELGTGIYGPERRMITPKNAKVLAWSSGRGGKGSMVFAKKVRGIPKQPFFKPAIEESKGYIDEQFKEVRNILVKELAGR